MVQAGMIVDSYLETRAEAGIEECTRCFAREILRGWLRTQKSAMNAVDVQNIKNKLDRIFSLSFPEDEISRLCSEIAGWTTVSH